MYHLVTGLYSEWTRKARYNVLIVGPSGVGKSCLLEKIKSIYLKRPALPLNKVSPTVGQNVLEVTLATMQLHFWDLGGSRSVRALWTKYYDEADVVVFGVDARDFVGLHTQDETGTAKGKGKGKAPDAGSEAQPARQEAWKLLSELLTHPSLDGRPILIVANKVDECGSIRARDLSASIKNWFATRLLHIDDDAEPISQASACGKHGADTFADDDGASIARAARSSTLNASREYEWDVLLTSAIDGTGVVEAVDWLSIRVKASGRSR